MPILTGQSYRDQHYCSTHNHHDYIAAISAKGLAYADVVGAAADRLRGNSIKAD